MKKSKIVLLHYSSPPVVGGVEEVMKQQALLLHRQGHKVKIISGKGESLSKEFPVTIDPIFSSLNPNVDLALKELKAGRPDRFKYVGDVIYEHLKKEVDSYDILIVHNVMTMPYNLPLTYAVKKLSENHQIKIISWNHDSIYFYPDSPDMYHSEPWDILKKRFPYINYVCISKFRCKQFRELYKVKEEIPSIPDGIDPAGFFQLAPDSRKIIHEQKLYEADLIMVQPSRLIPRKNIELGLKVIGAMKRMGIDVRYLITGAYDPHEQRDIKYYRRLKKIAKDLDILSEVIFIAEYRTKNGKKIIPNHSFIRDLYFIADILFMPSSSEGFGLPLLEAGVIKLPIACSDIPPFLEIGGNNVCTFSLADSPDRIADKILQFLSTIPTHKMYRDVIKNYAWDSIYENHMVPLFRKVMATQ
ncbi:MAG: glycosyltransferase family 4 protein [Deltaproteobacteria bacterium]|nr:glycosyltransferase family 4 protein [Deltaproteobacteria bacterium]